MELFLHCLSQAVDQQFQDQASLALWSSGNLACVWRGKHNRCPWERGAASHHQETCTWGPHFGTHPQAFFIYCVRATVATYLQQDICNRRKKFVTASWLRGYRFETHFGQQSLPASCQSQDSGQLPNWITQWPSFPGVWWGGGGKQMGQLSTQNGRLDKSRVGESSRSYSLKSEDTGKIAHWWNIKEGERTFPASLKNWLKIHPTTRHSVWLPQLIWPA